MIEYRAVTKSDLPIICSFAGSEEELFFFYPKGEYPLNPEQLQKAIEQRSDSTVMLCDGVVAGFANFYHWANGVCCIGNVVVAPAMRARGLASQLIRTMIGIAVHRHAATRIEISCFSQNAAGLLLYTSLGFEPFGIEERKSPDGTRTALINMCYKVERKPTLD